MLDKAFYEEEVKRLCLAFEQQVCISDPTQPKFLTKLYLIHLDACQNRGMARPDYGAVCFSDFC